MKRSTRLSMLNSRRSRTKPRHKLEVRSRINPRSLPHHRSPRREMRLPMTSTSKIAANRRNSQKSCGPRTAAGKSVASRNALRHGLAALTHRQTAPSAEIEQFASALCGNDGDPVMFAQAVKIAENKMLLQAIRKQHIAAVERLRERTAVAFAKKDNSLEVAKLRSYESQQAEQEIKARLPELIMKYKDK